jgi:pimeloyl-ACP methyl ester carboxylesterase
MMRAALLERAAARNQGAGKIPSPISSGDSSPPSRNLLAERLDTDDLMVLLERCFRRTEVEFNKLQSDVLNADNRIIEVSVTDFDAGKMLDTVQQLEMPTVLIHGKDDPLLPVPNASVWDYVTRNDDNTLAIPLPGVRHFPMLEHERFGRLTNDFLETADVNKLAVKERWRRRSR